MWVYTYVFLQLLLVPFACVLLHAEKIRSQLNENRGELVGLLF